MDRDPTFTLPEKPPEFADTLRQEQKLEMLGALAGFIAHDLNNELTVILGNVGLSLESLEADHPAYEGLVEAQQATRRCVQMTHGLLNLGQAVKPELKPVALDQLLKGTERILRKVLPSTVPTRFTKNAPLPTVMADASQIQQVILNLAANASNAMPEEGLLEVRAKNCPKYVTISISVCSVGRIAEVSRRLFEPLSETAVSRDESAFGLARDIEIMRAHGGTIDVARDRTGSTFRISLPASNRLDQPSSLRSRALAEGSACILIADDESPVRRAGVKILLRKGYNVIEAGDGEEAVRLFSEQPDDIDLVFLDVTMPGISGVEALEQIRAIRPGVKALLASGYSLDVPAHFLAKPYSPLELVRRIQQVLDAKDDPPSRPGDLAV